MAVKKRFLHPRFHQVHAVEIHQVVRENIRMRIRPLVATHINFFGSLKIIDRSKDVVPDDVLRAAVHVESRRPDVINEVVLNQHFRGTLVQIQTELPVMFGERAFYVVAGHIAANHRARLAAERVDAGAVGNQGEDIADGIILDVIRRAGGGLVVPRPAERNAGIGKIPNLVMADDGVAHNPAPDRVAGEIQDSAIGNRAVLNAIARGQFRILRIRLHADIAHLDAAATQIKQAAADDRIVLRAKPQADAIVARLGNRATLESAIFRAGQFDGGGQIRLPLGAAVTLAGQWRFIVRKREMIEHQMRHKPVVIVITGQGHDIDEPGNDDPRVGEGFPGARQIGEHTRRAVQIPFARRLQFLLHVLDEIGLQSVLIHRERRHAGKSHDVLFGINALDQHPRGAPDMQNHHLHVAQIFPLLEIARGKIKILLRFPMMRPGIDALGRIRQAIHALHADLRPVAAFIGLAIHGNKKLPERRPAGLDVGQFNRPPPHAVHRGFVKTGNHAPATEHRPLVGRRAPDHRRGFRPGIFRREHECFRQRVNAAAELHRKRSPITLLPGRPDRVARVLRRGQWFGLRAGIGIVAIRRNEEVGSRGHDGGQHHGQKK